MIRLITANKIYLIACLALGQFLSANEPKVTMLECADAQLQLLIEFPDFELYQKESGYSIHIPGCSKISHPGEPQLPLYSLHLAVPAGDMPRVSVQAESVSAFSCFSILPAPVLAEKDGLDGSHLDFVFQNGSAYSSNAVYPAVWGESGKVFRFRSQTVLPVRLFPIRYNPVTGEAVFAEQMIVRVEFQEPKISRTSKDAHTRDVISRFVCNPAQAVKWQSEPPQPLQKRRFIPNQEQTWIKVQIDQPGIYRITGQNLRDLGIKSETIHPETIQLFFRGEPLPLQLVEAEPSFGQDSRIEWAVCKAGTKYSKSDTYWLTWGGEDGERVPVVQTRSAAPAPVLTRGPKTMRLEEQRYYLSELEDQPEKDHWFWERMMSGTPFEVKFNVANLSDTSALCRIKTGLLGYVHLPAVEPDHHTLISINGTGVASKEWDGRVREVIESTFDPAVLRPGENTITFDLKLPENVSYDFQFLDSIELTWWQDYIADSDSLWITAAGQGRKQIQVRGLSSQAVQIYAFEDHTCVARINNAQFSGSGPYTLVFEDSLSGERRYLISKAQPPRNLSLFSSIGLNAGAQADYILIHHETFAQAALQLADFHRSRGLSVRTADVQSVYDEFNDGMKDPKAIKDFISYAWHHWAQPAPVYVLLMGDASYDFLDYSGVGQSDFVPTHLFISNSYSFETGSDAWFGCVSGPDLVPDLHIGRLPVRSAQEAAEAVDDIIRYHQNPPQNWQRSLLFVSDDSDLGGDFEGFTQQTIQALPDSYQVSTVYARDVAGEEAARQMILDSLNAGQLLVNYIGHGSMVSWAAQPRLFHISDVPELSNQSRMPLVMTGSCINGYFIHPDPEQSSMGEVFMTRGDRGAISVFTGAGYAYLSPLRTLTDRFYRALLQESIAVPGAAATLARAELLARHPEKWDHALFYQFFGDPALQMPVLRRSGSKSAVYSGRVDVDGESPAQGSAVFVRHYARQWGSFAPVDTEGRFDSLEVPADDPYTPQRDGAQPGDSLFFYLAMPGDTLQLTPVVEWQSGEHRMNFQLASTAVTGEIEIDLFVDTIPAELWNPGDPLPPDAVISAVLHMPAAQRIDPENLSVTLNGKAVSTGIMTLNRQPGTATLSISPGLPDGQYELSVAYISDGYRTKAQNISFRIQSALALEKVLVVPNPLQSRGELTFVLLNDMPADINVRCFSLSGRLLWKKYFRAFVGFNRLEIDAHDQNADRLANGVYLLHITARDEKESAQKMFKMMVMH